MSVLNKVVEIVSKYDDNTSKSILEELSSFRDSAKNSVIVPYHVHTWFTNLLENECSFANYFKLNVSGGEMSLDVRYWLEDLNNPLDTLFTMQSVGYVHYLDIVYTAIPVGNGKYQALALNAENELVLGDDLYDTKEEIQQDYLDKGIIITSSMVDDSQLDWVSKGGFVRFLTTTLVEVEGVR